MGRHATARTRRRILLPLLAIALAAVLGAATWAVVAMARSDPGCEPVRVVVAASPDIAPAVTEAARALDLACVAFDVQPRESHQVAAELSGTASRPQAWIPSSTLFLRKAGGVPLSGPSIASSPVVLAVAEPVARELGWPRKPLTWPEVLAHTGIVAGMPDPGHDPAGVSALVALRELTKDASDPAAAYVASLRHFSPTTSGATVFPAAENAVLRHNSGLLEGETASVAVYSSAAPALDYPFVEVEGATAQQGKAVAELKRALLRGAATGPRSELRAAGGQALRLTETDQRVEAQGQRSAEIPDAAEVAKALSQWAAVNASARVQVLIDVSGSMSAPVPGTGKSRLRITLEAAENALHLFRSTSQVRFLAFATKVDGDRDYREILPMAPIRQQLAAVDRLRAVRAVPDGQTGLYDSVLDIYRLAHEEWERGKLNLVIVMTDGRDTDPGGISRENLVAELGKLSDRDRPVPLIAIGIGPEADETELRQLVAPAGGQAFLSRDPAKIGEVFYGALGRIAGAG
ncbi:substrate-binding and VWA domain-containing protein [Amycolatopsis roodepoortensis]|uniref:substrate-binding and VWA domain-containing protein n=1 Tax=Amycolatopsis roodepoortensis TaxID=700274 RepID=UPI00214ABCAF|nr:substrate-binding and VWA domain-containing protein [Amycolatopsis roodepoortensis]UUV33971.1 substrate-binding and VWA domain-containing protein [Amycolatopsis roodepoortensis]